MSALPQQAVTSPLQGQVSETEWKTRVTLAASYRLLAESGVDDLTYNHLSARVPDQPGAYLVKSERQLFNQVTASSLVKYDFEGNKLDHAPGTLSRGGQVIHAGILAARADINAVFHTHTPANVGLSAQKVGLLPLNQHALRVYSRTAYHDFHGFEFDFEARQQLVESLGDKFFLVMRNHGVMICGRSIPEAFVEHHNFEFAARAQIAALSAGGVDQLIVPPAEVVAYATAQVEKYLTVITEDGRDWGALLKQAHAIAPDFAT